MQEFSGTKLQDLLLPVAVVGVVGMMVFPVPLWLLDILLMCNIAFALALLITSVYLAEPERFTSLPSILLLATLFRLGLNVSTTRQILAIGDAPATVMTFGNFVVQGSLIVGLVVFLIITLVQFLVVAKGAERVAEVAARFTLDGMPGKQMSIDADIRAGIISLHEAREKRMALQRESRLYGSLDGAMKFVKGDAIAGLIITAINISAGLLLGITQHGMTFGQAVERFTLFTIGDGLVSQIPALLVAVAAGIAVTRVHDEHRNLLGREMLAQLTEEPQAVAATAGVLALLGAVPGLPGPIFWVAAALLLGGAGLLKSRNEAAHKQAVHSEFRPQVLSGFLLYLQVNAVKQLQLEEQLPERIFCLRRSFFEESGIVMPEMSFQVIEDPAGVWAELRYHGLRVLSIDTPAQREQESLSQMLYDQIRCFVYAHRADLLDDTQTRLLLEMHRPLSEDLINSVIPEVLSVTRLTTLLRELAEEEVSIRSFHDILQAIAEFYASPGMADAGMGASMRNMPASVYALKEPGLAVEVPESEALLAAVRCKVRKSIQQELFPGPAPISVLALSPELDRLVVRSGLQGVPFEPAYCEALAEEIGSSLAPHERCCVLTSRYARKPLVRMLRDTECRVAVLAVDELGAELEVNVCGELSVARAVPSLAEQRQRYA